MQTQLTGDPEVDWPKLGQVAELPMAGVDTESLAGCASAVSSPALPVTTLHLTRPRGNAPRSLVHALPPHAALDVVVDDEVHRRFTGQNRDYFSNSSSRRSASATSCRTS